MCNPETEIRFREAMYVYRYACIIETCIASYNLQLKGDAQWYIVPLTIVGTSWCTMIPLTSFPLNICNISLHALWPATLLVIVQDRIKTLQFQSAT